MYLGIDPSLSCTGLCLLDKSRELIHYDTMNFKAGDPERLLKYKNALYKFIKKKKVKRIGIEGYAYAAGKNRGAGMVFNIGEHGGAMRIAMQQHKLSYLVIVPTQLKKFITGNGRADKEIVASSIERNFGYKIEWSRKKERLDLYDALGIAIITYYFYRRKRRKELKLSQREILKTIDMKVIKDTSKFSR